MKTEWDYTELAAAYLKRPAYSDQALQEMYRTAKLDGGEKVRVCDVGAGTGILTTALAKCGYLVDSVEPNDEMRKHGIEQTKSLKNVSWFEGKGEATGRPAGNYDLVTFGSSFNVLDRPAALKESSRILKPSGWFACMWNHRELSDPLQEKIESIIKSLVKDYSYGTRREDQTDIINSSHLFGEVRKIEGRTVHQQSAVDCIEAWRSHATLARQAGAEFHKVVQAIENVILKEGKKILEIPYTTRIWMAKRL